MRCPELPTFIPQIFRPHQTQDVETGTQFTTLNPPNPAGNPADPTGNPRRSNVYRAATGSADFLWAHKKKIAAVAAAVLVVAGIVAGVDYSKTTSHPLPPINGGAGG